MVHLAMRFLHPAGWPRPHGYTNGVAAEGTIVHLAGQVGWDPLTERFSRTDLATQVEQALRNILTILAEAGGGREDLTRLTLFVTDAAAYRAASREIGMAYRAVMGGHYPAMTLVQVAALFLADALVEIEATAVIPSRAMQP